MTTEQWFELVKAFGLPFAMLVVALFAFWKRWIVTAGELADKQLESDGWKALYQQERGDRVEAQQLTLKRGEAAAEVAEAVASGFEKVLGRLPDPYDERLEGRRNAR